MTTGKHSPKDGNYLALGSQSVAEKVHNADAIKSKSNKCNIVNELTDMSLAPYGKAIKTTGLLCVTCLAALL